MCACHLNRHLYTWYILTFLATMQVLDKDIKEKEVAAMIIEKLKSTNVVVPFAEIARSAKEEGKNELAALVMY